LFAFHPQVAAGIAAARFTHPTPIQVQAIPPILEGRDILGLAQTGTGKTAAFALPILQRLLHGPRARLRALILAPTRELAGQIHDHLRLLGSGTRLRSAAIFGGVGLQPQVQQLRQGLDIAVACPGRLLDHMGQGNVDFSDLEVLVLDEADRMCDMGFLPDIRRILRPLPPRRQTLFFSATMPEEIRTLARELLHDPVTVHVGRCTPPRTVSHALFPVAPHLKTPLLLELLQRTDKRSVLVFTRTKHRARRLGEQLSKAGYRAASLQGNLSQNRRQAALDGFRDGTFQVLVATDIASRGIDVSQVSHVINYDMPGTAEDYIHRIGRTGRAACSGEAFTLMAGEDAPMVAQIERSLGGRLERRSLSGFDYHLPAPQRDEEFARPAQVRRSALPNRARRAPAPVGGGAPRRQQALRRRG
jgi:ATP-dependent RNA helicase RhlE